MISAQFIQCQTSCICWLETYINEMCLKLIQKNLFQCTLFCYLSTHKWLDQTSQANSAMNVPQVHAKLDAEKPYWSQTSTTQLREKLGSGSRYNDIMWPPNRLSTLGDAIYLRGLWRPKPLNIRTWLITTSRQIIPYGTILSHNMQIKGISWMVRYDISRNLNISLTLS